MFGKSKKQQRIAPGGRVFIFWLILVVIIILAVLGIYCAVLQEQKMQLVISSPADQFRSSAGLSETNTPTLSAGVTSDTAADPTRRLAEKSQRPALGNAAAGLVIVEFADFQCPICHEEFYQIREFVNRHQNEVYYIYRHYAIIGDNSVYLAKASMCAYEQGKFWPLHDKLFLNQGQIESEAAVTDIARQSGVDIVKFDQCMQNDKYRGLVFEDMSDAVNLGVAGTPTFFVNGRKLEGAVTLADWEKILEKYKETKK